MYLAVVLCLGVLATLLTGWVLHLYHRHPARPMSTTMRYFVARVLVPLRDWTCLCERRGRATRVQPAFTPAEKQRAETGAASLGKATGREKAEGGRTSLEKLQTAFPPAEEAEVTTDEESTWQEVAAMFDRLFLVLYLIIMPAVSGTVLVILYDSYY